MHCTTPSVTAPHCTRLVYLYYTTLDFTTLHYTSTTLHRRQERASAVSSPMTDTSTANPRYRPEMAYSSIVLLYNSMDCRKALIMIFHHNLDFKYWTYWTYWTFPSKWKTHFSQATVCCVVLCLLLKPHSESGKRSLQGLCVELTSDTGLMMVGTLPTGFTQRGLLGENCV